MALHVGITGGIGSGKTLVCHLFATLGIPVYYADERAKIILQSNDDVIAAVKNLLGNNVYSDEGILNRKLVATLVFSDSDLLAKYNAIIHPAVLQDSNLWMHQHASSAYILKEAALLFESGSYKSLDKIICVTAPEILRIERVMRRDTISENAVKQRMKNQWSEAEKAALSDYIIINDGNTMLIPQVMNVHQQLSAICN
ncbi:MAG: dephospho-CoA kinase [Bacteroidetes bacterium]|nr:dephospho-CoA kinase [Bacteroidota bacterium]MBP7398746.1 dephospho-CoA kinase [Chitinophagales bacterium]MBK8487550.1 dephospho-CoA kinase [Bacteroidota bacterium]MBK8682704.1 dephospho-CoA kinase [Bacteroidota bacterium]MBP8754570.1 dephospho-CoA kinase [Chitinophagales bacterium]